MSKRIDSHIIEHNEDGTWVETTVVHGRPATTKEKATAWTVLGAVCIAPFAPLVALIAIEKWEARRDRKEAAKKLKSV
jgi:hypothetical protein